MKQKQWKLFLLPEEMNDLFWYMMGETSYGRLDEKIVNSSEYKERLAKIEESIFAKLRQMDGVVEVNLSEEDRKDIEETLAAFVAVRGKLENKLYPQEMPNVYA